MEKDFFPTAEEVKDAIRQALRKFYLNDSFLFHNNVHERTLTFRLGIYLQELFFAWNVDCEYNKNIATVKGNKLLSARYNNLRKLNCGQCTARKNCTVFPDIIIHRRGTSENLLVIEAKKNASEPDKNADIKKIKEYLKESTLKYRYGLFLDFKDSYDETISSLDSNWVPVDSARKRDHKA